MAQNNKFVIECRNIKKTFKARKEKLEVLKGIDLSVSSGEIVVIAGKSGTGKSTLVNIISGIEPATEGEVLFQGIPYKSLNNEKLAKLRQENIGIIFQSFNLISSWTAFENIEAAVANDKLSKIQITELISSYMEELGILKYKNHKPSELSIGQQQRVAVIRAIINEPKLILGDEPTGDVDIETGDEIMGLLLRVMKKTNATMIVGTHGEFSEKYATRILTLKDGKLTVK